VLYDIGEATISNLARRILDVPLKEVKLPPVIILLSG
jgi:hypothetical protein